ncbi:ATP-grasp domain-containing protein [Streptomyces mangrovisoli]|uniref:Alpha-L-glutamate ligase n=1 Tax=Streptomyces mangrovisoli TaxID=1428628 RepID=A0A1J4P397_9ACTN|nr:alpha-L-glutamate ligase [Streptomyces mangrovisoli]OIJ68690.1 alpha-L-glutamate ligase [Streptomyces mangrovisoli]
MPRPSIALIADPTSPEGCRDYLADAVHLLTGAPPVRIDARHFAPGGGGRAVRDGDRLRLHVRPERLDLVPDIVVLYEIPPERRAELSSFQRRLARHGAVTLDAGPAAWRTATRKDLTVERFARDGIPQMETVVLSRPSAEETAAAFGKLGRDTWARPVVGTGGNDTFHVTTEAHLRRAAAFYADRGTDWLLSRDAGNITADGDRHQFRVFVMGDRVVHAREHVQPNPDTPCNTCQGATPVHLTAQTLPPCLADIAVRAAESVGLPFAGVDLAVENGGVVFEVNVHPAFVPGELEAVAVPYIQAHLDALDRAAPGRRALHHAPSA